MQTLQLLLAYKAAFIPALLVILLVAGRFWPYAQPARGLGGVAKNLGLAGLNAALSALVVLPLTALATGWAIPWRPSAWQGAWALLLDVVLLDAWIYLWHRANHALPWLWRFHQVHHLDEALDASTALRFHAGEVLLASVLRAVVVALLAVPFAHVVVFEVLVAALSLFHHSNLRVPRWMEQPLSWVVVTPSIHWVHHHPVRTDTDSNYATVFSCWDRLLGTRSPTQRHPGMALGLPGLRDRPWLALLAMPFQRLAGRS